MQEFEIAATSMYETMRVSADGITVADQKVLDGEKLHGKAHIIRLRTDWAAYVSESMLLLTVFLVVRNFAVIFSLPAHPPSYGLLGALPFLLAALLLLFKPTYIYAVAVGPSRRKLRVVTGADSATPLLALAEAINQWLEGDRKEPVEALFPGVRVSRDQIDFGWRSISTAEVRGVSIAAAVTADPRGYLLLAFLAALLAIPDDVITQIRAISGHNFGVYQFFACIGWAVVVFRVVRYCLSMNASVVRLKTISGPVTVYVTVKNYTAQHLRDLINGGLSLSKTGHPTEPLPNNLP